MPANVGTLHRCRLPGLFFAVPLTRFPRLLTRVGALSPRHDEAYPSSHAIHLANVCRLTAFAHQLNHSEFIVGRKFRVSRDFAAFAWRSMMRPSAEFLRFHEHDPIAITKNPSDDQQGIAGIASQHLNDLPCRVLELASTMVLVEVSIGHLDLAGRAQSKLKLKSVSPFVHHTCRQYINPSPQHDFPHVFDYGWVEIHQAFAPCLRKWWDLDVENESVGAVEDWQCFLSRLTTSTSKRRWNRCSDSVCRRQTLSKNPGPHVVERCEWVVNYRQCEDVAPNLGREDQE